MESNKNLESTSSSNGEASERGATKKITLHPSKKGEFKGIATFPYLSMQLNPDTQTAIRQAKPLFAENNYNLQPGKTPGIASKMLHLMDHDPT